MHEEPNSKHYTRGGHLSMHNLRMWDQITKTLVCLCLFLWVVLTGLISWFVTTPEKLQHALAYYYASFLNFVGNKHTFRLPFHGKNYQQSVNDLLHYPYYQHNAKHQMGLLGQSALSAFSIACLAGLGLAFYFIRRGKAQRDSQFIRGSKLDSLEAVKELIVAEKNNSDLHIDSFPLIKHAEVQHMLVHGTIGMGKSQLIMKWLDQLRKRGDRVIIYDSGCSYTQFYFDESTDVLLNPYDTRCANWDLWLEAPADSDLENTAHSLIPIEGESQPFFVHAARAVFSASASKMRHESDCSLKKLLQFLLTNELEQMEPYLAGTPAATLMSDKVEKMAVSVRAMITTYVRSLQALYGLEESGKEPFSIRNYILDEKAKGWLFISSNGEKHNSLKPLISMWLSIASLALLSLPEDLNRRVWLICDELPSLHQLPFLETSLAQGRKFGACFILGMQNYFQLSKVYGDRGAKAMFDLLNTRFFFRSPSAEVAKFVSIELCNEELEEVKESTSYGANSVRDGISLSKQRASRPLVDYSEIKKLPILSCFVDLPGDYPVVKLKLKLEKRPELSPGFMERVIPKLQKGALEDAVKKSKVNSSTTADESSSNPSTLLKKSREVEFHV